MLMSLVFGSPSQCRAKAPSSSGQKLRKSIAGLEAAQLLPTAYMGACVEGKLFPHQPVSPCPWMCPPSPSNSASPSPLTPICSQPFCQTWIPKGCPAYLSFPAYRLQVKCPAQAKAKYLDPAVSTGLILSPEHYHSSSSIRETSFSYPAAQSCQEN